MRTTALIALFGIFLLVQAAEFVPFGESALNPMFKEKKSAVILFTSNQQGADVMQDTASGDEEDRVYTVVDEQGNAEHYNRFAEYLGISVAEAQLVVLKEGKKKYVTPATDLSGESIADFTSKVDAGEVKRFLKSAAPVENDVAPVKTLVGSNYEELVNGDEREFLVKVYAPWCGHCKKIAPEFVAAAEAISANPNIVLAEFDGTLNEVDNLDYSGFPTLFW